MGDPGKIRRKHTTPAHMWQGTRIADEKKLKKEFGLKNNREVWRAEAFVSNARRQARLLIGKSDDKADAQKKLLLGRLSRLGIIAKDTKLADILALNIRDVLDRRLQTILHKKGIAKSMRESRQMILHRQVKYCEKVHTIPGTIVPIDAEDTIAYGGPSRTPRPPRKKKSAEESPAIEGEVKEEAPAKEKKEGGGE